MAIRNIAFHCRCRLFQGAYSPASQRAPFPLYASGTWGGERIDQAVAVTPFTEGKPNGFLSFRSQVWRDTDNQRAGMLPWAFESGMGFERYVDYALDVPMYFIKRGDKYIDVSGKSFRAFFEGKLDVMPGDRPTISDWANHLSTIFPEVRLKNTLELLAVDRDDPAGRVLGRAVVLHSHVAVAGATRIGDESVVFPFASLGHRPQDLKFRGEETTAEVGDNNTIRENVTIPPRIKAINRTIGTTGLRMHQAEMF